MISAAATISENGLYRYSLSRSWDDNAGTGFLVYAMLNPSKADAMQDDPTIRRCMSFARKWGYAGVTVINIFALRATDPVVLQETSLDIFGPDNAKTIRTVLGRIIDSTSKLICAWGANPLARQYSKIITHPAFELEVPMYCLGTTKDGSPRHPLYVPGNTPASLWMPYREAA